MFAVIMDDPAKDTVLKFLGSYIGLSVGVALLISGLKAMWKTWVENKEPVLAIILTFVLGNAAKIILPDVYGPNTIASWALHEIVLTFVVIGAGGFHDYVINATKKQA
ncbi:MAG: hypothetical protein U0236_21265 [Nitrospira sp.]